MNNYKFDRKKIEPIVYKKCVRVTIYKVLSMNVKVVEEKNSFIQNKKCKFQLHFLSIQKLICINYGLK